MIFLPIFLVYMTSIILQSLYNSSPRSNVFTAKKIPTELWNVDITDYKITYYSEYIKIILVQFFLGKFILNFSVEKVVSSFIPFLMLKTGKGAMLHCNFDLWGKWATLHSNFDLWKKTCNTPRLFWSLGEKAAMLHCNFDLWGERSYAPPLFWSLGEKSSNATL